MTNEELFLFKELIKETVRSVIKEEQENSPIKKELKEVKLLLGKIIKEGYLPKNQPNTSQINEDLRSKIREAVGEDFKTVISRTSQNVSSNISINPEQATNMSINGALPNIDAPIPTISKNSLVWKSLKERVS